MGLADAASAEKEKPDVYERILVNVTLGCQQRSSYGYANRLEILE
jgi:hypothetical protein